MPEPSGRLKRAAIMAFGATLVAACGDKGGGGAKNPTPDSDAGVQVEDQQQFRHPGGGGNNMPYGAPPADGPIKRVV